MDYLQETGLTASAGIVPEAADLGVEAGLNVVLDEGIHNAHEKNTDHNADDDTLKPEMPFSSFSTRIVHPILAAKSWQAILCIGMSSLTTSTCCAVETRYKQ